MSTDHSPWCSYLASFFPAGPGARAAGGGAAAGGGGGARRRRRAAAAGSWEKHLQRPEEGARSPKADVTVGWQLLGTELRTSGRTASVPNL